MGEASDPVAIFMDVFKRYMRDRGHMILSMAQTAGQKKLRISLRGLWRRYEAGSTEYYWFMDVVNAIRSCNECLGKLREEAGILGFWEEEGEPYIIVDVSKLKRLYENMRNQKGL